MRILRLAELYFLKYAGPADQLETSLRKDIHSLWNFPNKLFNVLKACAESHPKNPKTQHENMAVKGFEFCQKLLSMIDYLQANVNNISLGELREVLNNIIELLKKNIHINFDDSGNQFKSGEKSTIQFPHVSALIFEIVPSGTVNDRVVRDQQFSKAKIGLSRILSLVLTMLEKISKLELMVPEKFTYKNVTKVDIDQKMPERFSPDRTALSVYDIIDFIKNYGPEYGIYNTDDWETLFINDPKLKEDITTVINAVNRGHYPRNSSTMKMEIARILKEFESRKSSNKSFFEES